MYIFLIVLVCIALIAFLLEGRPEQSEKDIFNHDAIDVVREESKPRAVNDAPSANEDSITEASQKILPVEKALMQKSLTSGIENVKE